MFHNIVYLKDIISVLQFIIKDVLLRNALIPLQTMCTLCVCV